MKQINIVNLAEPLNEKSQTEIQAYFSKELGTEVSLNIKQYAVKLNVSPDGNIEDDVDAVIEQIQQDFGRTRTGFQAFIPATNGAAAHLFAQYEVMMQTEMLLIVDGKLTQVISW